MLIQAHDITSLAPQRVTAHYNLHVKEIHITASYNQLQDDVMGATSTLDDRLLEPKTFVSVKASCKGIAHAIRLAAQAEYM